MTPGRAGARAAALEISEDLGLPIEAGTETSAIIANRGTGKSSSARTLVEELCLGEAFVGLRLRG